MARNAGGTYSLPAGNPVVSGATIDSSDHNSTMSDIASEITDSLSRSGKGGMSAPLELDDGTVSLPGLAFVSDTDTGLYRIGADDIGVAIGGVLHAEIDGDGVAVAIGAVGTPGLSFLGDRDTGLYKVGDNRLGIAANGTLRLEVDANAPLLKGDYTQADFGTGGKVYDGGGNLVPVGYNVWPFESATGDFTLDLTDVSKLFLHATGADVDVTVPNDADIPVGAVFRFGWNVALPAYNFTFSPAVGVTMYYSDRGNTVSGTISNPSTHDPGAHALITLYKQTDTIYRMYY